MRQILKRYHRRSIRLKGHDYSQSGAYFVTICCQNRKCLFGEIIDREMVLNEGGDIASLCWREIPNHFPHVGLDEFIIMPNHLHGILMVNNSVGANNYSPLQIPVTMTVQTPRRASGTSRTIGSIIRGFKIGVTKWFRQKTGMHNVWQRNYYEHIIRDEKELNHVRKYILDNPLQWQFDRNNPNCVDNGKQKGQLEEYLYGKTR